jgi:hypothetical protein
MSVDNGECYESYPWSIIVVSNTLSLAVYGLGAFVIYQLSWVLMAVYLAFIAVLEIRLLAGHCVHCYYYGHACAFGKGKLSALFFKRGDPARFVDKEMTWWNMVPDLLVVLVPAVIGIIVMVRDFSWVVLGSVVILLLLATVGNSAVRSSLACKRCKQRELGCPAEALFNKAGS